MSVLGFDVGDFKSCVAVARRNGVDVLLNKESKRETPAVVSFGMKQRAIGTDGSSAQSMNPKNTVFGIKQLLGKKFLDPIVQREIPYLPFKVKEGGNGGCLVDVMYLNERVELTPERVMAIVLTDLATIAETEMNGERVKDCVVSIPNYYTESERSAMLDAVDTAGLKCLRLIPDTTATALAFGIYKQDLSESEALNVAFVDVGHSSLQCCVTAFKKGQMKVLSQTFDRDLGGRTFDNILFDHFCEQIKATQKIDVSSHPRASLRLRKELVKVKKVLSANSSASFALECIMDDKDVKGSITREELEQLSADFISKIVGPCQRAVEDAGLTVDQVAHVELVGSASRVPIVASRISEFFGKEVSRNLNVSECVSKGCALQCAMLSPVFRVRDYDIQDYYPYSANFSWKKEGADEVVTSSLFPKGNSVPSVKMLTFLRSESFQLQATYGDDAALPAGTDKVIGQFEVAKGGAGSEPEGKSKLKVQIRLNLHGLVEVESVHSVKEETYEVEVIPEKPAEKPKAMEVEGEAEGAEAGEKKAEGAEEAGDEKKAEEEPAPAPKKEVKKRTVKTTVDFKVLKSMRVGAAVVRDWAQKEIAMREADVREELTKEARNSLEEYILTSKSKVWGDWNDFVTSDDRNAFSQKLDDAEDWMYSEEGEDATKEVLVAKTSELRGLGDPIEERFVEASRRGPAAAELRSYIQMYATLPDHLSQEDKDRVAKECAAAATWLEEREALQEQTAKTVPPVLMTVDIKKKGEVLNRVCQPIASKPAPPPPKEEKKEDEEMADAEAAEKKESGEDAEMAEAEADGVNGVD